MLFTTLLAIVSLALAGASPIAAADDPAPAGVFKQATRAEVIERMRAGRKRQASTVSGVTTYAICPASVAKDANSAQPWAIFTGVNFNNGDTTATGTTRVQPLSELACRQYCDSISGCAGHTWGRNSNDQTCYPKQTALLGNIGVQTNVAANSALHGRCADYATRFPTAMPYCCDLAAP